MAGALHALASYVQNMVLEMATEEMKMLVGVSSEIENMGTKLGDLKNFLADADRKNITENRVQAFVRELRDAMYEATDILDLCQLKAMEQGPRCDIGCLNPLLFCIRDPRHAHDIGSRIKNLNKRLDSIKARGKSMNFIDLGPYEDSGSNTLSYRSNIRETSGGLDESSLVGEKIEVDTANLVEMLTKKYPTDHHKYNKILVFSIVGVGGIGKTTLAQKIFNNEVIKHEFTKKIWLSVNQDFDDTEMFKRVIIEAGGDHRDCGNSKVALERNLIKALNGQKTLLIMDDVWNHKIWEGLLRTPFINAMLADGSRVLVTTRKDTVAQQMLAEEPFHPVEKLGREDAWLLLKKQVVRDIDEPQVEKLKDIGMRLVEKCDSLPLAVKVMGGLLRQKRIARTDWENVVDGSLWSLPEIPEELNYAIYLSYQDLPPWLKPCFLHYSILPRGTIFSADLIIGMWISEGFVHGTSGDLEVIGRGYYDQLIHRNLIDPDRKYVNQNVCNMHDIVRSFAHYVLGDEALIAHNSQTGISDKLKSQKFIRLSLENKGSEPCDLDWCSLQTQTSLRTLISVGNSIKIKPGDSFLSCPSLRTLWLDSANLDALAESLYQLKHLRYFSIERSDITLLPDSIGKLKFLQYINLGGCERLSKLPSSFGMLRNLRFLGLPGTSNTMVIPRDFGALTSLRKLHGFPTRMDGDQCSLGELGPLSQLIELTIFDLENADSSSSARKVKLAEKKNLRYLSLSCTSMLIDDDWLEKVEGISEKDNRLIEEVFDELCPPLCLERLYISGHYGKRLPSWMMPTAATRSLRFIIMHDLACCTDVPSGLCELPSLEILLIENALAIKCIGLEFVQPKNLAGVGFPRLHSWKFSGFIEWEEWAWEEQVTAMPMLHTLHLEACLWCRLPPGLAFNPRALKTLYIHGCINLEYLENFPCVVTLEMKGNTELERISNFPKLQRLIVVFCDNLKLVEGTPALQRFNLEDHGMETVPSYLQNLTPRHLRLDVSITLVKGIAAGKSSPEWDKISHIEDAKAFAREQGNLSKWYVLYTRDPFRLDTNISSSASAI